MKESRIFLLILALVMASAGAHAQNNKSAAKGAANGKPFQYLQEQIDSNAATLDALAADHGAAIESIQNQILELQAEAAHLQDQIDSHAGDITALEAELALLNLQIAAKQDVLLGSCAEGSSLRAINADGSFICEYDDIGQNYISIVDAHSFVYPVVPYDGTLFGFGYPAYTWLVATCPAGYTAIGGGGEFLDKGQRISQAVIAESRPEGINAWYGAAVMGHAADVNSFNQFKVTARCMKHY